VWRGVFVVVGTAGAAFVGVLWLREDLLQSALAALGAALVLPYLSLHVLRRRRHGQFAEQFADAIDIIVRSLRAGHPIPVAISMVAREMGDPVGTEFGIVGDEITYGADLETAMRNLSFRVGQEDLPLFVTAVAIQGSTGGNLSEILANLSGTIRQRFKMRRKIRALASEGRFSAYFLTGLPLVIFGLLELVSPDFYGSIWDQDATKIGLGCAAAWMMCGNFIMYRMVNFRI
jgi:tight adherence protein B